jgi:hypothetical protein
VPDRLVADLVNDFRNYSPTPRSAGPAATVRVSGAGTVVDGGDGAKHRGWQDAPKVDDWRAPGIDVIDQLCEAQDRADRAALVRKLDEVARVEKELQKLREPK